jgi:hypothetical protein
VSSGCKHVHITGPGTLLGYVELFSIYHMVVRLSDQYTGPSLKDCYAVDPTTGEDLDLNVDLTFGEDYLCFRSCRRGRHQNGSTRSIRQDDGDRAKLPFETATTAASSTSSQLSALFAFDSGGSIGAPAVCFSGALRTKMAA